MLEIRDKHQLSASVKVIKRFYNLIGERPAHKKVELILRSADKISESDPHYPDIIKIIFRLQAFLDSFGKLKAPQTAVDELRKQYPGTIFILVFQTTTAGNARGGTSASFDCSVEIIVKKSPDGDFKKNSAWLEKNRYGETGKYLNVFSRKSG